MLQSRICMHMWCAFFTLNEVYSERDVCDIENQLYFFVMLFLCYFGQVVIYLPKILYLRQMSSVTTESFPSAVEVFLDNGHRCHSVSVICPYM